MTGATYLAYDTADALVAQEIARVLDGHGLDVRLASEELRQPGEIAALAETVAQAQAVVAILSPTADANEWVRREVLAALNNGRRIIPVIAQPLPDPSWLGLGCGPFAPLDIAEIGLERAVAETLARTRQAAQRARVIAMLNIKGGVGKTVLAANLFAAAHLADNRAIVFVDLDPQHNLTQYFLPPSERHRVRAANQSIYSVLKAEGPASAPVSAFTALAQPLNRSKRAKATKFDLVAGDERLFEYTLDSRSERERLVALARFGAMIHTLAVGVDAVVIDANPCATFLTRLAIAAADHIVAPVRPEKYSLTGLNMLEHVVAEIRGRALRSAEFSVLLNGVNDRVRSRTNEDADAATRAEITAAPFFGAALLPGAIPYSGALKATPSDRYAVNPINVTAMVRVASREVKESLAQAAAAVLRRAAA
jgi:chromosome partitioning protein